ncbi:UNVERIFIED_CONTAM: putative protein phosphatase 2C 51 [Sesamum radiatum]|uniref:Uncharacterized protein n=1 Tax=Sesamum radiatum TaxID=300843 RepID=A0AAW2W281_SESRA
MKFGVFDLLIIILIGLAFCADNPVAGESLTCLTVYKEGGAPAVFQSPKCPRWTLSSFKSQHNRLSGACQSAMLQGRRKSQEDRIHCAVDLRIPFPGPQGLKEVKVGIMAVFDGHNGSEASEMASELLLEYFVLHTYFLLDSTYSTLSRKLIRRLPNKGEDGPGFQKIDWNDDLDRPILDFGRYILKKKFDRGAFGEVWLAFDWNCSQVGKDPKSRHVQKNISYRNKRLGAYGENTAGNASAEDCNADSDGNMFILKRIMGSSSPVSWKCSEEYFSYQIKNRDPLKLGFPNVWALRLVRDLLRWDPEDRLGVDDALKHPYFSSASWKSTRGKV